MQLVAYGAQDIYLTGNPQITFFKVVYRRHTNFSMEAIEQTWNGTVNDGNRVTATISRNGDLVHRMYLEHNATSSDADKTFPTNHGNNLVSEIELEIGGQRIDKHTGHWMETWAELTEPNPTGRSLAADEEPLPGFATKYQRMTRAGGCIGRSGDAAGDKFFVPLQFWFCRNPGLALPLIALQYHEVKVVLTIGNLASSTDLKLYADYIYLDTDERRRFAQVSHEYLIEQVQEQSYSGAAASQDSTAPEKSDIVLNFNHPVKELIFSAGNDPNMGGGDGTGDGIQGGKWGLKLNGHERFTPRDYEYFTRVQVWSHHSGYGGVTNKDSIGVYSFALKPEEHQPSGTCNFSRIDNAVLTNTSGRREGVCYAVNYNVLRIMSGMGGLAYSN